MDIQQQKLIDQFGAAIGGAAASYLPAMKRMAMDELLALGTLINEKNIDAAKDAVRDKMTDQELADETVVLAGLIGAMADANKAKRDMAKDMALAIFKAALGVLLSAVFL